MKIMLLTTTALCLSATLACAQVAIKAGQANSVGKAAPLRADRDSDNDADDNPRDQTNAPPKVVGHPSSNPGSVPVPLPSGPGVNQIQIGMPATPPPVISPVILDSTQTATCNPSKTPAFGTINDKIYGPDQRPFMASGVGVINNGQYNPSASEILSAFPGTNFIRLAIFHYESPDSLAASVKDYTSHGMVVELENHDNGTANPKGGGEGQVFTGAALTQESNWFSSVAKAFGGNPYVWFGTANEPPGNASELASWQMSTYQAIRGTGNTAPIMLETGCGPDPSACATGMDNPLYKKMTNVIADLHMYGWLTNYNTSQSANDAYVKNAIAGTQKNLITGGVIVPVIIGEYGNSTDGVKVDPNGQQMVAAVGKSGVGTVAWLWGNSSGDGLNRGDGYGAQVAKTIAAAATHVGSTAAGCQMTTAQASPGNSSILVVGASPSTTPEPQAPTAVAPEYQAAMSAGDQTSADADAQMADIQAKIAALHATPPTPTLNAIGAAP